MRRFDGSTDKTTAQALKGGICSPAESSRSPTRATRRYTPPLGANPTHGFTLIELLAVILVIGILAGILIPVISNVRENALMSKSVGNLRALGTIYRLYSQTNNNQFPGTIQDYTATNSSGQRISNDDVSTIGTYSWQHSPHLLLQEGFVESLDSFYCPAQTVYTYPDNTTAYGRAGWAKEGYFIGYVHYRLREYGAGGNPSFPKSYWNKSANSDPGLPLLSNLFPGISGVEEPLFGDTLNYVRVDGSVGQVSLDEFLLTNSWTERFDLMMGDR